jgi:2-polyprenyl-3-methyl-5-hydroxy-6-metoxy-1,4-benzoquinol methylase
MPAPVPRREAEGERLASYSTRHPHLFDELLPPLLVRAAERRPADALVDLGAGDGANLWALEQRGLLGREVYGVDISPERVEHLTAAMPRVRGIVASAINVHQLGDGTVDAALCSQVIEHLPDDTLVAPEIARLVRRGGWFYVSSVIRSPRAWWVYRHGGRWWLDPTHEREYGSPDELLRSLEHPELHVEEVFVQPLGFPISDLVLRAGVTTRLIDPQQLITLYTRWPALARRVRRLRLRPFGYSIIEVVGTRSAGGGR